MPELTIKWPGKLLNTERHEISEGQAAAVIRLIEADARIESMWPVGTEVSLGGNIRGEVVPSVGDGKIRVRWPNGNRASYTPDELQKEV